jgi:hypothetical protein
MSVGLGMSISMSNSRGNVKDTIMAIIYITKSRFL